VAPEKICRRKVLFQPMTTLFYGPLAS